MSETEDCKYLESEIQRIDIINSAIENMNLDVDFINKSIRYNVKEWALVEAKLKKEKLVALTALAKSKLLLAEMEVHIAETELNNQCSTSFSTNSIEDNYPSSTSSEPKTSYSTSSSTAGNSSKSGSSSVSGSSSPVESINQNAAPKASEDKSKPGQKARKGRPNKTEGMLKKNSKRKRSCSIESTLNSGAAVDSSVINMKTYIAAARSTESPHNSTISITPLNDVNASKNIDKNKSLTDLIIKEFDKSSNKENSLPLNSNAKKRKINPVANIEDYKNTGLSKIENVVAKIIHLHSRDPRKYLKCDLKEDSMTETPMKLPLPRMMQNRPVPAHYKNNDIHNLFNQDTQISLTPTNNLKNHSYNLSQTTLTPEDTANFNPYIYNTPVKTPVIKENGNTLHKQCTNYYKPSKVENISQYTNTMPQLTFNSHICLPPSPAYIKSGKINYFTPTKSSELIFSTENNVNFNNMQKYVPKVELSVKTKALRTPTGPTKVCFYNSS